MQSIDITAVATTALDRVGEQPATVEPAPAPAPTGSEPIRHKVARGETVFSISRLYDVPVRNIAEWNGLGAGLEIREGQYLLIPQGATPAPLNATTVTDPVRAPKHGPAKCRDAIAG